MVDDHAFAIETERKEKDHWFRESHESPLPLEARHAFTGLPYYPVDPGLRFHARLVPYPEQEVLTFSTSKGSEQSYHRHGFFEVAIEGQIVRLNAYKPVHARGGHEYLFIPFRDATSGKETYGAGRYLDLPVGGTDTYDLDFNKAYNPYCAYSDDYVCPLPPPENWLAVPVRAGEKAWSGK
jgi:uncharacterized protein (DUF1684 family)